MHIDIVIFNRYNHAVTWATRHFISLISIRKKYESNFKEISKLHLPVVIYECTSGQRKHRLGESMPSKFEVEQLTVHTVQVNFLIRPTLSQQ